MKIIMVWYILLRCHKTQTPSGIHTGDGKWLIGALSWEDEASQSQAVQDGQAWQVHCNKHTIAKLIKAHLLSFLVHKAINASS